MSRKIRRLNNKNFDVSKEKNNRLKNLKIGVLLSRKRIASILIVIIFLILVLLNQSSIPIIDRLLSNSHFHFKNNNKILWGDLISNSLNGKLNILAIEDDPPILIGKLSLSGDKNWVQMFIDRTKRYYVQPYSKVDNSLPIWSMNDQDIRIPMKGSVFDFPFSDYKVLAFYFPPTFDPLDEFDIQNIPPNYYAVRLDSKISFEINLKPKIFSIYKADENSQYLTPYGPALGFIVSYSTYYKYLVVTIIVTLVVFLIAIWKTNQRSHIVELSVGVFASLLVIKGFLVPPNILNPLLIDQILLVYLVILMVSFLIKYLRTKDLSS